MRKDTDGAGRATQEAILRTAERLFAEHGITAVSSRRIAEEAGAANNSAVGYHFGTKNDLVLAMIQRWTEAIEGIRAEMVAAVADSDNPRDHLASLVLPSAVLLDRMEPPTYHARFMQHAMTDPALREQVLAVSRSSPSMLEGAQRLQRCLAAAGIPPEVAELRGLLVEKVTTISFADYERMAATGERPARRWRAAGEFVVDAVTGLLLAPVTEWTR
ncbi:AcrR family transcriptional regulator [Crossiella equi]|uniref:AcrR family transcriptional regulator n=1 Tax=Crossiella equi TaxID=130796 RepID=A0ABS5AJE3_9PSEU|nr:TetR/AcrR family transcriptional regulator [Crossiella equi]MBP2476693.1 AcrR family transcriptional regulator [Crossiella equi]